MAVQVVEKEIGGYTYRVTQLTALKARALFSRLIRFVGPAIATAVSSGKLKSLLDVNLDVSALVGQLTDKFTDEELTYFCTSLGACSELVNGDKAIRLDQATQDVHFAGRLLDMFRWMGFALEVNFSDFLSELKAIQGAKSTAPASADAKSQDPSTGTSGVS